MFTVKLMSGQNNSRIQIIEAREVEIRMNVSGSTSGGVSHAVITKPGPDGLPNFWHYVGNESPDNWEMAVVENAAGRTTEVIRSPGRPDETMPRAA